MNSFGEKEAWGYPGTAQIFWVPPIISGTGKATDFKLGQYIQRVYPNKSPLKILERSERGRIQGLPKFFGYPLLSQEREKLISNLASILIQRVHPNKSQLKILEKRDRGRIQGLLNFLRYPLLSQERESYGFQIWPVHSEGPSEQKSIKHFREKGAWAYPETAQFLGTPYYLRNGKATDFTFGLASKFRGSI